MSSLIREPTIADLTNAELICEWWKWDMRVRHAPSWSAALGVAAEFRDDCAYELQKRHIPLPTLVTK